MLATKKQINYLEILFSSGSFDRQGRNSWLSNELNREIKFLDELSSVEASKIIEKLKAME